MYRNVMFHNIRAWKCSLLGELQQPLKSLGALLTSVGTGTVPDTWSSWNMNSPEKFFLSLWTLQQDTWKTLACFKVPLQLGLRCTSLIRSLSHQAKLLKMLQKQDIFWLQWTSLAKRSHSCSATISADIVHNGTAWQLRVQWSCDCLYRDNNLL